MDWTERDVLVLVFELTDEILPSNDNQGEDYYPLSSLNLPNFKVRILVNKTYTLELELLTLLKGTNLYGGIEEQLYNFPGNNRISLIKDENDPYNEGLFFFKNGDVFDLALYKKGTKIPVELEEHKAISILQSFIYEVVDKALELGIVNQYYRNYYIFKQVFRWREDLYKELITNVTERNLCDKVILQFPERIAIILDMERLLNTSLPEDVRKALLVCKAYDLGKEIDNAIYEKNYSVYMDYVQEEYVNLFFNKYSSVALELGWSTEDYNTYCENLYDNYKEGWIMPSDKEVIQRMRDINLYIDFCNTGISKHLQPIFHQKVQEHYGKPLEFIKTLSGLKQFLLTRKGPSCVDDELPSWLEVVQEVIQG